MKLFGRFVASMYLWTIFLLSFLAVTVSYKYRLFPVNLLLAILATSTLDVIIKKFLLKRDFDFPFSAIITGIIIGSIAPFNSSPLVILLASVASIVSKFLIRIKGFHIFNPATFGLFVSLFTFNLGDQWWAAESFNLNGFFFNLTPLLVIANYKARRLYVAIPFLLTISILSYSTGFIKPHSLAINDIASSLFAFPYYFAFIMVSEPKTSPAKKNEQIIFGICVAILSFILTFYGVKYSLLIALLLGNFAYALYRNKIIFKISHL
jgi:Na+-translocating ferredoxin:NAD+ oxidoreductase RnfD subunit